MTRNVHTGLKDQVTKVHIDTPHNGKGLEPEERKTRIARFIINEIHSYICLASLGSEGYLYGAVIVPSMCHSLKTWLSRPCVIP